MPRRKAKATSVKKARTVEKFKREREALNKIVLDHASIHTKRFFNLDTQVYQDGNLPRKMKELLGLVASLVLRCDDCVLYHLIQCYEQGVEDKELEEALSIGLVVGGSITVPHLRRAFRSWEEIKDKDENK